MLKNLVVQFVFNRIYKGKYSEIDYGFGGVKNSFPTPIELIQQLKEAFMAQSNPLLLDNADNIIDAIEASTAQIKFFGDMHQTVQVTLNPSDSNLKISSWFTYSRQLNDLSQEVFENDSNYSSNYIPSPPVLIPCSIILQKGLGENWKKLLVELLQDPDLQDHVKTIKASAEREREQEELDMQLARYTQGDDGFFYHIAHLLHSKMLNNYAENTSKHNIPDALNMSHITKLKIDVATDVFRAYVEYNAEQYSQFFPGLNEWLQDRQNELQIKDTLSHDVLNKGHYNDLEQGQVLQTIGFQWYWKKFNFFENYASLAEFQNAVKAEAENEVLDPVPPFSTQNIRYSFILQAGAAVCGLISLTAFAIATVAFFSGIALLSTPLVALTIGGGFGLASFGLFKANTNVPTQIDYAEDNQALFI